MIIIYSLFVDVVVCVLFFIRSHFSQREPERNEKISKQKDRN